MEQIKAPFTDEQVKNLNEYQHLGFMHEFTCAGQPTIFEDENGKFEDSSRNNCPDGGRLKATNDGWVCPCGLYTQNWAHEFMADVQAIKDQWNNSPIGKVKPIK